MMTIEEVTVTEELAALKQRAERAKTGTLEEQAAFVVDVMREIEQTVLPMIPVGVVLSDGGAWFAEQTELRRALRLRALASIAIAAAPRLVAEERPGLHVLGLVLADAVLAAAFDKQMMETEERATWESFRAVAFRLVVEGTEDVPGAAAVALNQLGQEMRIRLLLLDGPLPTDSEGRPDGKAIRRALAAVVWEAAPPALVKRFGLKEGRKPRYVSTVLDDLAAGRLDFPGGVLGGQPGRRGALHKRVTRAKVPIELDDAMAAEQDDQEIFVTRREIRQATSDVLGQEAAANLLAAAERVRMTKGGGVTLAALARELGGPRGRLCRQLAALREQIEKMGWGRSDLAS